MFSTREREIKILSRADCHLCEVVKKIAQRLQEEMCFRLSVIDVSQDDRTLARYGSQIPVVLIDDFEALSGTMTEGELRRAIKRARWSRPVSRILSRLSRRLRRG